MQMKLMLVDDHPLFLEGLQYLLKTHGIDVVGTANDGKEALIKCRTLNPDIILMDIRMPECSGIDALKLIKAEMPDVKIVMLTTSEEDDDLFEAIKCGASGYLIKIPLLRLLSICYLNWKREKCLFHRVLPPEF